MKAHYGNILVPMAVLMLICAAGALYIAKYIHVVVEQSLHRQAFYQSLVKMDENLRNVSSLLAAASHDTAKLPSDITASVTSQTTFWLSKTKVTTSDVQVKSPLSEYFNAQTFVQYPWIKSRPDTALSSRHVLASTVTIFQPNNDPQAANIVAVHGEDYLPEKLFSVADAVHTKALPLSDCNRLNDKSSGPLLIEQDCVIAPSQQIGSPEKPVLLIISNANLIMHNDSVVWGIVISSADSAFATYRITSSQTARINGSVIVDHKLSDDSTLSINYSAAVIEKLQRLPQMQIHHPISGTWRDF